MVSPEGDSSSQQATQASPVGQTTLAEALREAKLQ
jgi:hypothetical protein